MAAHLCLRPGTVLDPGDRAQPGVEAADAGTDDPAQRRHGVIAPFGRHERELRHTIPLAKTAAALRSITFSSSSRFPSLLNPNVSAPSPLRAPSPSAEPAASNSVRQVL